MKTCGGCLHWPMAGSAPLEEPSQEGSANGLLTTEGTSGSMKSQALTRGDRGELRQSSIAVSAASRACPQGVRGPTWQDCPQADKAAAVLPAIALRRIVAASWAEAGWHAVKHATVGGWMTARWSGVLPERSAETPRFEADPHIECRRACPRRAMGSPKMLFLRVLVTRSVGCRNGFEASWRCGQAEPRGEASRRVERRRRPPSWTRSAVFLLAEGCSGHAKGESPVQAARSWCLLNQSALDWVHRIRGKRVVIRTHGP